jgi:hypothetical protein
VAADIPTLNQSTTGNAATATNIGTSGTGNQVWGMNAGGTAQGWQNAGGGSMTWPAAAGIAVYAGSNAWGTSLTAPTGAIVGTTDTQTLTNKTLDGVSPATMAFVDPTSSIQTQINAKANLISPIFTGNPTAPTQSVSVNSTRLATTAFVRNAMNANYIGLAQTGAVGGTSDTITLTMTPALNSVGLSAGTSIRFIPTADNTNSVPTLLVDSTLGPFNITKCAISPLVASDIQAGVPAALFFDGSEWILENPLVGGCGSGSPVWGGITGTLSSQTDLQSALNLKATLASPTFTGTPAAPTAANGTNTTQLATTAFVNNEVATDIYAGKGIAATTNSPTSGKVAINTLAHGNYPTDCYYVDQIAGSDSNNGLTAATAFQTIAHLTTVDSSTNKVCWLLVSSTAANQSQRHWREQMTVPRPHMVVNAYNASYNNTNVTILPPLLDATDVIPNANWALVSGQTTAWQASITIAGWATSQTNVSVNLYRAGNVVGRASSLGACEASGTALMFISSDSSSASATIYVCGIASPITDSLLYEFSSRYTALLSNFADTTVDSIATRGNYIDDGSLDLQGDFSIARNVTVYDGNKHNLFMAPGSICENSLIHNGYYGNNGSSDAQTLAVSAGSEQGYTLMWDGCHALQDANIPLIPGHNGTTVSTVGFYSHAGPGLSSEVIFRNSTAKGLPDGGFNADTQKTVYENVVSDGGIIFGRGEVFISHSKINALGGQAGNTQGPVTGTLSMHCRDSVLYSATLSAVQIGSLTGTFNVDSQNCTYNSAGGTAFYQASGTTGVINFNGDTFISTNGGSANNAVVLFLNTTPTSFSSDNNVFSGNGSQEFQVGVSTYDAAGWPNAINGNDTHSKFYPPGCLSFPCKIGFNGTSYVAADGKVAPSGSSGSHTSPTLDISAVNASAEICAWAADASNNQTISITAHGAIWGDGQADYTIFPSGSVSAGDIASGCKLIPYYNSGVNVTVSCTNSTGATSFICGWSFTREN